jgi:hypothetical protein
MHGPCLIHRRTYAPVAEVIAQTRQSRPAGAARRACNGQERDNS